MQPPGARRYIGEKHHIRPGNTYGLGALDLCTLEWIGGQTIATEQQMIKRILAIAAIAAAFGLSASPAKALISFNGTQLTGIALQEVKVTGVEPQRVDIIIPE
jgi:hypothetical protein